jgi:hypothetical protein
VAFATGPTARYVEAASWGFGISFHARSMHKTLALFDMNFAVVAQHTGDSERAIATRNTARKSGLLFLFAL